MGLSVKSESEEHKVQVTPIKSSPGFMQRQGNTSNEKQNLKPIYGPNASPSILDEAESLAGADREALSISDNKSKFATMQKGKNLDHN